MAVRQIFKILFRRTCPLMYTTASMFAGCVTIDKPDPDAKIKWEPPDVTNFTHEYMIKQSTVEIVNSVTQALTIAYTAIESTSKEYRKSLSLLMSLMKETLSYNVVDSHWDLIVAARSEMEKNKQVVTHLVNYMEYVQKMGVTVIETCYMAGMDNLSSSLCKRMDDALNNMTKEVSQNLQLEKEYIILQQECVKKRPCIQGVEEDR